jgi:hypothetical protein
MTRNTSVAMSLLLALSLGACRPPAARAVDMRARIEEAIRTEVEPLHRRPDVEAYLERLRRRAVAQRRVTALEVEPGVAAIERLMPELGPEATQERVARFVQSMTALSREYRESSPKS